MTGRDAVPVTMLKRLVLALVVLTALVMVGLYFIMTRPQPAPRTYDVREAVRELPVSPEVSPEIREQALSELNRAGQALKALTTSFQAPPPSDITELEGQLASLEARLRLDNADTLSRDILTLRRLWIEGRAELVRLASSPPDPSQLPQMPPFNLEAYGSLRGTDEAESYLNEYDSTQRALLDHFLTLRSQWEGALSRRLALQTRIRALRESYLEMAHRRGISMADLGREDFLQAVHLELDSARVRLAFKALLFRLNLSRQMREHQYLEVLKRLVPPLLALSLVVAVVWPGSHRSALKARSGSMLAGLLYFSVLRLTALSMDAEFLVELAAVTYLASNLVLYRTARQASRLFGRGVVQVLRFRDSISGRRRATATLTWLAGLLLLRDSVLELVNQLTSGRALVYWSLQEAFTWVLLLAYLATAYAWRSEIVFQLQSIVGPRYSSRLAWLENRAAAFFIMPFLLPVWLGVDLAFGLLLLAQRTEWGRRAAAGAMRHYIERLRGRTLVPLGAPAEYSQAFLAYRPPVEVMLPLCDPDFWPRLTRRLDDWLAEMPAASNRLTLVGRSGSEIGSLIDLLEQSYRERVRFCRICLENRRQDLHGCLAAALAVEPVPDSLEGMASSLRQGPPRVVVVENFHFLFLSALGGFEPLRNVLLLARLAPGHVFWVLTGGYHAQAYLNRVLVSELTTECVFQVPAWSERALGRAVLEAHQTTNFKLSFDPDLGSLPEQTGRDDGLEAQYFRILWEHSGGNPSTARALWLRSLHPTEDGLVATLPPSNQVGRVQTAPTALHLVLAAVVRHQDLDEPEVVRVTDLDSRVVRLALIQALEWGVLKLGPNSSYSVHPAWVKDLEVLLKRKNMLYVL